MQTRIIVTSALALAIGAGVVAGVAIPNSGSSTPAALASTPSGAASTPSSNSNGDTTPAPSSSNASSGSNQGVTADSARPGDIYPITKLAAGQKAPQFVVISFDGACKDALWKHYLDLAKTTNSRFTFFLSGLCLVPDRQRFMYHPPHKAAGTSAIGFGDASLIPGRITNLTTAYNMGNEIGTHFLGHFCDAKGVGIWSSADWQSEIDQARNFLDNWKSINGNTNPNLKLPFSSRVWVGDRTPCLAGKRSQMYPVFAKEGFKYDASGTGSLSWPHRIPNHHTMWNFPLQDIKVVGYGRSNLSMDYNFLYAQNNAKTSAPQATCDRIQTSTYKSFMLALKSVHSQNRAPLFIGNHFNNWVCGAYKNALTSFIQDAHSQYPDVRFVTFEYLTRWLDAQSPSTIKHLQSLAPAHEGATA
jgi:hypothetical protein